MTARAPASPEHPVLVGIAGPSGSGKTTLARQLCTTLGGTLLPLDAYYRSLDHLPIRERANRNFDHPDALESDLLVEQLRALAHGHAIDRPCYDFVHHTRKPGQTERIKPTACVVVEGILALHYPELRALFDLAIYVETPVELCLARRLDRDTRDRGRTAEAVREQFRLTTQPMAEQFVLPSAAHADLVVLGSDPVSFSLDRILAELRVRSLLPSEGT